jgi:hypothetical protein
LRTVTFDWKVTENYDSDELLNCAIFHPRKEDQNGINGRFGWPVQGGLWG